MEENHLGLFSGAINNFRLLMNWSGKKGKITGRMSFSYNKAKMINDLSIHENQQKANGTVREPPNL